LRTNPEEEPWSYTIVRFRYLGVPGLLQKYYLRFRTGEHGGVYVWDSAASMERFMASRLARTICDVYRVDESVRDVADVVFAL